MIEKSISKRLANLPAEEQKQIAQNLNGIYTRTQSKQIADTLLGVIELYRDIPGMADWVTYQLEIGTSANDNEDNHKNNALGPIVEKMAACYNIEPMVKLAQRLSEGEFRKFLVFSYINDFVYMTHDKELVELMANFLLKIRAEFMEGAAMLLSASRLKENGNIARQMKDHIGMLEGQNILEKFARAKDRFGFSDIMWGLLQPYL